MTLNITITPQSQKLSGVYVVVNLDYDQQWPDGQFRVSRPTRNKAPNDIFGLPATARFADDTTVKLVKDLQLWVFGILRSQVPEMDDETCRRHWASITDDERAFTNHAGSGSRADYINGTNLSADDMVFQPMVTGGTVLKLTGKSAKIAGEDCYQFEAINALGDYGSYTPESHPHLFFQPSNSVRRQVLNDKDRWTGAWIENISDPFWQFNNKSILPIFAAGNSEVNYIQQWRVRPLGQFENWPSPFTR